MPEASPIHVVIEDDDNTVRTDPETGTIETDQADGGVVIQFGKGSPSEGEADSDKKWFRNLAEDMDPMELGKIANELIEAIEADHRSREGHLAVIARGYGLLGLKLVDPKSDVGDSTSASEGMSSVTNPLLLEALLKAWANARAELL